MPCLSALEGWQQGGSRWQQNVDTNYHELYVEDKNRKNLFPRCIPNICVAGSSKARNRQLEGEEQAVRWSRSGSSSVCTEQTERKYAIYDSKVCYLGVLNRLLRSVKWATFLVPFITESCRLSQKFGCLGNYLYLCTRKLV